MKKKTPKLGLFLSSLPNLDSLDCILLIEYWDFGQLDWVFHARDVCRVPILKI